MTMRERIASGKLFTDYCEGLPEERLRCKKAMNAFNRSEPDDVEARLRLMSELFGKETKAWIEPPSTVATAPISRSAKKSISI